jgi:hypothetical protein
LAVAGSGASASTTGSVADIQSKNTGARQVITLGEEEIFDVSLSTFYVFDKENTAGHKARNSPGAVAAVVMVAAVAGVAVAAAAVAAGQAARAVDAAPAAHRGDIAAIARPRSLSTSLIVAGSCGWVFVNPATLCFVRPVR